MAASKTSVVALRPPQDVRARLWVLGLEPRALHARVTERLTWRAGTSVEGIRIPGSSTKYDEGLVSLNQFITAATAEVKTAAASREGRLPLSTFLSLVQRLTIDIQLSFRGCRRRRVSERYTLAAPEQAMNEIAAWIQEWFAWCTELTPPRMRLLDDYEIVYRELSILARHGELTSGLHRLVGPEGRLTLGSWSCQLTRTWRSRARGVRSPSQWAEALLAIKHGTHTRAIKEQLAVDRKERDIEAHWSRYRTWLSEHPNRLADLEARLGVSTAISSGPDRFVTSNDTENSDEMKPL